MTPYQGFNAKKGGITWPVFRGPDKQVPPRARRIETDDPTWCGGRSEEHACRARESKWMIQPSGADATSASLRNTDLASGSRHVFLGRRIAIGPYVVAPQSISLSARKTQTQTAKLGLFARFVLILGFNKELAQVNPPALFFFKQLDSPF